VKFVKQYDITDFESYKEQLLEHIEYDKENDNCLFCEPADDVQNVTAKSDFLIDYGKTVPGVMESSRRYSNIVNQMLKTPLRDYAEQSGCDSVEVTSMWWTEYSREGGFSWHTHQMNNLIAIIQVHLDSPEDATKVWEHEETLKEGQLIIFPSSAPHGGFPTKGNKKVIIAVNLNVICGGKTQGYQKFLNS
jgi:hypothetical protein